MKKSLKTLFLVMLTVLGFGQALAQDPQNFTIAGFNMGSGVTAWTAVAGDGGYGQMNFNPGGAPLVNSYASNQYGNVAVYARPWANGAVMSGFGGSGTVSASFTGGGGAGVEFSPKNGVSTYTSIQKSVSFTATSTGNGSATVNGGFDISIDARGFIPPAIVVPVFELPPSPSGFPGGKG